MATIGGHAVVLGAGMGGLLAARVLADAYRRVTVVERDRLPAAPEQRRGVPQGAHGHTLLPGGTAVLGALFEGLGEELEAAGVPVVDTGCDLHFNLGGHVLYQQDAPERPLITHVPSRPLLEWRVRQRVHQLPNVSLLDDCPVAGPVTDGGAVSGVRLASGERLDAELVVDATGRGSRTPAWLEQLGYPRPVEQQVKVGVSYVTRLVRILPPRPEKLVLVGALPDRPYGLGLFHHENEAWEFTVFGVNGVQPPTGLDEMVDTMAPVLPPELAEALRGSEPLADPARHRFPASRWRRYDKLRRHPEGLIAFGDAVASFNPTYGQGMTVAAQQAIALAGCLRDGPRGLPKRFHRGAATPVRHAWRLGALADYPLVGAAVGPMPLRDRFAAASIGTMYRAAEVDPVVSERFLRVIALVDPPNALLSPAALLRVGLVSRRRGAGRPRPAARPVRAAS
ncbi:MAG: FAD-dependent oxidoreductase [Micromonosporaceae bacterium]